MLFSNFSKLSQPPITLLYFNIMLPGSNKKTKPKYQCLNKASKMIYKINLYGIKVKLWT